MATFGGGLASFRTIETISAGGRGFRKTTLGRGSGLGTSRSSKLNTCLRRSAFFAFTIKTRGVRDALPGTCRAQIVSGGSLLCGIPNNGCHASAVSGTNCLTLCGRRRRCIALHYGTPASLRRQRLMRLRFGGVRLHGCGRAFTRHQNYFCSRPPTRVEHSRPAVWNILFRVKQAAYRWAAQITCIRFCVPGWRNFTCGVSAECHERDSACTPRCWYFLLPIGANGGITEWTGGLNAGTLGVGILLLELVGGLCYIAGHAFYGGAALTLQVVPDLRYHRHHCFFILCS
jgi:hypothetical protein